MAQPGGLTLCLAPYLIFYIFLLSIDILLKVCYVFFLILLLPAISWLMISQTVVIPWQSVRKFIQCAYFFDETMKMFDVDERGLA